MVWEGTCSVLLRPLTAMQKRIIRIITSSDFLAQTNLLFHRLKILKLFHISEYYMAFFMETVYTLISAELVITIRDHKPTFFLVFRDLT